MEHLFLSAPNKAIVAEARKALAHIEGLTIHVLMPEPMTVKKTSKKAAAKARLLADIREGMADIQAIEAGNKPAPSLSDLIAELKQDA